MYICLIVASKIYNVYKTNIREKRRADIEWTIQIQWAHKPQDKDKQSKITQHNTEN